MNARRKKHVSPTPPTPDRPRTGRSISVPLLLGTAIVLAVLAVSTFFWHRYQVDRLAPELLEQARMLEAEGKLLESTQRIYQYLQIKPDDAEARIALASTYDALATDVSRQLRAIELYTEAVRTAPAAKKADLNRRLGALLLQVARFQMQSLDTSVDALRREIQARLLAAMNAAIEVLDQDDQDPEGWRVLAWTLLGRHQLESLDGLPPLVSSVGAAFELAAERNPADIQLAIQLANLYRTQVDLLEPAQRELPETERGQLADASVDRAVAANADEAEAYLARASYRSVHQLEGVQDDLDTALRLAPESATVQLAMAVYAERRAVQLLGNGELLEAQQQREQAVGHLHKAIELQPTDVRAYLLLSQLQRQQGQPDAATRTLEQGLAEAGEQNLQLNALLAELLLDQPEQDEALWKRIADHISRYNEAVRRLRPMLSDSYRRALDHTGDILQARLLVQRGESQAAVNVLEQLLVDSAAVALPQRIVAWRLREQAHRALGQWEPAAEAAEQLVRLQPDDVAARILTAINLLAAERPAEAVRQLSMALAAQESLETRILLAAASLEQQRRLPPDQQNWKLFQENLTLLRQADANRPIPRPWRLTLLQAGYQQAANPAPAGKLPDAVLEQLRQAELAYPDDAACLQQVAAFYNRSDAQRDAQRVMTKLNVLDALQQSDWAAAEKWEQQLQGHGNNPPAFWQYYRARRLLAQASGPDDPRLDEVGDLHTQLAAEYPQAKNVELLRALLHDTRGNVADAITGYQAALAAGVRNTNVLERLIVLLAQTGRFDEAETTLATTGQEMPDSTALRGLRILVQRSKGDLDAALLLAEQDVADNPRDPLARLRLGRLYEEQEKYAPAEKAYQEAVILDPRDIRGMSALFDLYAKTDRQQEAEALLQDLAADPRLTESQRVLMLATGKGLLGQADEVEKLLRDAIAKDAADPGLPLALAASLARRQQPESLAAAEGVLRDALKRFPESAEAKRRLANLLIERGGEADRKQAQELVEELAFGGGDAGRGDAFTLAQLYDREGNWGQARETLQRAAAARDATPEQLAAYIDRMLRENTPDQAQSHMARLEELAPNHRGTIRLKIRWLLASQRAPEIPAVIADYQRYLQRNLTGANSAAGIHSIVGELHLLAGDFAQAEARFRQLQEADPSNFQPLLAALAGQQRLDEAIQLCQQIAAADKDSSPVPAIALATTLTASKPTPQQLEQAEPLFTAALKAHGKDPRLLETLATLRLVHHQTEQAIALYRQLLEIDPQRKDPGVLNNLAVALSESEATRSEALAKIDEAIGIAQRPTYLDTKATILLLDGRNEEAVELLERALSGPEPRAVHQLHLAIAYARSGQDEQARKTLAAAQAARLEDDVLTATDLAMLEELRERYKE